MTPTHGGTHRSGPARPALGAAAVGVSGSPPAGEQPPLPLGPAARALAASGRRTVTLAVRRRIHQPAANLGRPIAFADGTTTTVYRETVIERDPPEAPAVLIVCFRLRRLRAGWAHLLFRVESELNTVLFAGFPGLVSKLWLRHDQRGLYRGIYQWDGATRAEEYVRALWWALALVSEPGSIHYAVLPGLERDRVLDDPTLIDTLAGTPGGWWRPT